MSPSPKKILPRLRESTGWDQGEELTAMGAQALNALHIEAATLIESQQARVETLEARIAVARSSVAASPFYTAEQKEAVAFILNQIEAAETAFADRVHFKVSPND